MRNVRTAILLFLNSNLSRRGEARRGETQPRWPILDGWTIGRSRERERERGKIKSSTSNDKEEGTRIAQDSIAPPVVLLMTVLATDGDRCGGVSKGISVPNALGG